MIWLALRLTLYNRTRLAISLAGVAAASYLTIVEVALYIGMMENATAVIRHAGADLWIASKGIQNFDFPKLFPIATARGALAGIDVAWAEPILLSWGFIKRRDGAQEQVEIIGYDPQRRIGGPWLMEAGNAIEVAGGRYVIVDTSARQRLGALRLGDTWSLNDTDVRLVGISRAARTFTTAPIVFASYDSAEALASDVPRRGLAAFVAVKTHDAGALASIVQELRARLPDNEVLTTREFVQRTILYWTVETGMGAALCLSAALALIVGAGVIGQTVFANTMEHLRELATLKAMGADRVDLATVVLGQALSVAAAGYSLALVLALASQAPLEKIGVSLALDPSLVGGLALLIVAAGGATAQLAAGRVRRLEPASVFRA